MIVEGNVSVKAALLGKKRTVYRILVDEKKSDKDTNWILYRAKDAGVSIEKMKREELDQLASGKTYGGILAEVSERTWDAIDETLQKENPFVALVEGVEDPFNLGYMIRTLYSAGCDAFIIRKRDWSNVESGILKSSAGALEYMNVVQSDDMPETVRACKKAGLKCFAAMRKDAISCFDADFTGKTLIAIGGEMRGLSKNVLAEMDQNIYIPYANDFHMALNAAAASAVLGFEVFKSRKQMFLNDKH